MIGELLKIVAKEASEYIDKQLKLPSGKKSVILQKPTNLKGELDIPNNTISLSLLNIEEEVSIRNPMVQKQVIDGKVYKQEPPLHLNLQLIFIANFANDYMNELNYITKVIEFFQRKPSFTSANTKGLNELKVDKLTFKLNTLALKDQNNIWSMLGIKYMPSVVYKVGIITLQEERKVSDDSIVKEVDINVKRKK